MASLTPSGGVAAERFFDRKSIAVKRRPSSRKDGDGRPASCTERSTCGMPLASISTTPQLEIIGAKVE
jgi:hypothetical protein